MSEQSGGGGGSGMQKGKQRLKEGRSKQERKGKIEGRKERSVQFSSVQLPVKSRSSNFLLSQRLGVF